MLIVPPQHCCWPHEVYNKAGERSVIADSYTGRWGILLSLHVDTYRDGEGKFSAACMKWNCGHKQPTGLRFPDLIVSFCNIHVSSVSFFHDTKSNLGWRGSIWTKPSWGSSLASARFRAHGLQCKCKVAALGACLPKAARGWMCSSVLGQAAAPSLPRNP